MYRLLFGLAGGAQQRIQLSECCKIVAVLCCGLPTYMPLRRQPTTAAPASRRGDNGASPANARNNAQRAAPPRRVLRELVVGDAITVRVVEADISTTRCAAVVNAANQLSFKPMDGGVSGALRRACAGMAAPIVDAPKRWWDDEGVEHVDAKLPVTQAGVQAVAPGCALHEQGVRVVVHAVGPNWSDYPMEESTFDKVRAWRAGGRESSCICGVWCVACDAAWVVPAHSHTPSHRLKVQQQPRQRIHNASDT